MLVDLNRDARYVGDVEPMNESERLPSKLAHLGRGVDLQPSRELINPFITNDVWDRRGVVEHRQLLNAQRGIEGRQQVNVRLTSGGAACSIAIQPPGDDERG